MMNEDFGLQILGLYRDVNHEAWDLHAFFELAGDAGDRRAVLEIVDRLVAGGYLDSRGSDFYTITEKGKRAAQSGTLSV